MCICIYKHLIINNSLRRDLEFGREGSGRGMAGNKIDAMFMYKIINENTFLKYLKCAKF